jgi:hypothetical protein
MIPDSKVCSMCGVEKSKDQYHIKREKGKEYLKSRCKVCCVLSRRKVSDYSMCKCGNKMRRDSTVCVDCRSISNITVKDCKDKYNRGNKANWRSVVSSRARAKYSDILQNPLCDRCGYSEHVEVCHIRPVHSFSDDTLLDSINDDSNVIFLCPNCHWEFDHGRLTIDKIGRSGNAPDPSL